MTSLPEEILEQARQAGLRITTAESCTGGLICASLIDIAGSSDVVDGGFVTYSNFAKMQALDVPKKLLQDHGAVSEPVARAMAEGALANARTADVSVATTGIAGPGGAGPDKPAGLVHIAASRKGGETIHSEQRFGDIGRNEVRRKTVEVALKLMQTLL
jgi:nicotinamide-nucleotide amidase